MVEDCSGYSTHCGYCARYLVASVCVNFECICMHVSLAIVLTLWLPWVKACCNRNNVSNHNI